jgi:hypothetical protein
LTQKLRIGIFEMARVEMICHCGEHYFAREADLKRGWGYSCDKSCSAKRRDFSLPKAVRVDGLITKKTVKKPSGYRPNDRRYDEERAERERQRIHNEASVANEEGWDGHKNAW